MKKAAKILNKKDKGNHGNRVMVPDIEYILILEHNSLQNKFPQNVIMINGDFVLELECIFSNQNF